MSPWVSNYDRDDGGSCSMSAYRGGPWRCGSGDCMGRRPDCGAARRNALEADLRERLATVPYHRWVRAWEDHYGVERDPHEARAAGHDWWEPDAPAPESAPGPSSSRPRRARENGP